MSGLVLPRTGSKASFSADEQYSALNKARAKRQRKAEKRKPQTERSSLIIKPTIKIWMP